MVWRPNGKKSRPSVSALSWLRRCSFFHRSWFPGRQQRDGGWRSHRMPATPSAEILRTTPPAPGLDTREGGNFGLVLDLPDSPETQYELFYGFQRTSHRRRDIRWDHPLDLDIHYLHLGGTYMFPGEKIRPYIAGGLGATHFVPNGSGLNPKTFFSPLAGRGSQDTDLQSRRSTLGGEGVADGPAGHHGDLLRVVRRRCLSRERQGGRIRPVPADGGDHLFVVGNRRRGRKPRCMATTTATSPIPTASNIGLG